MAKVFQTGVVSIAVNDEGIALYVHQQIISGVEGFRTETIDGRIRLIVKMSILASPQDLELLRSLAFVRVEET